MCRSVRPRAAAPVLDDEKFYADCRALLCEDGVMSVNLFGRRASFERSMAHIAGRLRRRPPMAPQAHARRQHDCGSNTHGLWFQIVTSRLARADNIESRYGLPARQVVAPGAAVDSRGRPDFMRPHRDCRRRRCTCHTVARQAGVARPAAAGCARTAGSAPTMSMRSPSAGGADSHQHPLVRLGSAGLKRAGTQTMLDTEALTQWLAQRFNLTLSAHRPAESRCRPRGRRDERALRRGAARAAGAGGRHRGDDCHRRTVRQPLGAGDRGPHAQDVRLAVANPLDIARYTTEFFSLAKSVRAAQKTGENSAAANFEQLVELGKTNKQLDANDAGVVQVVDWLWHVRVRPARQRHPPRAAARHGPDPLSHRWRAAHRVPGADDGDERDDGARQAARSHGRDREAPPARRPHQDQAARWRGRRRRRGRDAAVHHCPPRSARRW